MAEKIQIMTGLYLFLSGCIGSGGNSSDSRMEARLLRSLEIGCIR